MAGTGKGTKLRSQQWFDNPDNPGMTALYLERYLNFGLTRHELQSGKPLIGIAQTGSDLSPCNRHHIELAKRVREGITAAGGVAFEFPCHPIQETGKRPTASLDRNLAYLGLVEVLYGYPLDGVVLTIGCDKTTPAMLMAAATVNIPAIALSVGPMLNGWHKGERTGSGTIVWKSRERLSSGEIDYDQFMDIVASSAPSVGYCNTMGTATTMNSLAEALGMQLPGSAAIPAPYRERGQISYETGKRIVDMVWEDLKPSDIMTREAFENAIVVNSAIGGSTNAPIHLNAIARHLGVPLDNDDWQKIGHHVPLIVNLQPAGEYLGEDYHHAGGVPAVVAELMKADLLPYPDARTVNGKSIGENCKGAENFDAKVILPVSAPLKAEAGFINLKGNLFDTAIMKTSVIYTLLQQIDRLVIGRRRQRRHIGMDVSQFLIRQDLLRIRRHPPVGRADITGKGLIGHRLRGQLGTGHAALGGEAVTLEAAVLDVSNLALFRRRPLRRCRPQGLLRRPPWRESGGGMSSLPPQRGCVTTSTKAGSTALTTSTAFFSAGPRSFGSVIGPATRCRSSLPTGRNR